MAIRLRASLETKRGSLFTVYGDAVNLASRLEGLGKYLKSSILLDEATGVVAGDVVELTRLGAHPIRGVDGQIEVFAASSAA